MKRTAISSASIRQFATLFDNFLDFSKVDVPDEGHSIDQLSPWHFWTLVCFARHHTRQNWVADIVKFRLRGDLDVLAGVGALGHPDIPQSGVVPKDLDWEYYFHGRGCCLTHRGTGESIDVDFFDDTGDYFSLWFYRQYLKSLRDPEFPEKRLLELHPSIDSLEIAARDLFESDAFSKHPESNVYKLSDDITSRIPAIEQFVAVITDPEKKMSLAIQSGDWLLAQQISNAGGEDVGENETIEKSAQNVIRGRLDVAKRMFDVEEHQSNALAAINEVSPEHAKPFITRLLKNLGASGAVGKALDLIHGSKDPAWCPLVFEMIRDNDIRTGDLRARNWHSAASFLLEHGFQRDYVIESFDEVEDQAASDFALLALKHAPSKSLPLLRQALRSSVPMERTQASAMLVIIDQPWSYAELAAVLSESDDQEMTLYARAGLLASKHAEHHAIVEAWELANPRKSETGNSISVGEWAIREKDSYLAYEIQKLHDQVWPLRNVNVAE